MYPLYCLQLNESGYMFGSKTHNNLIKLDDA